MKKRKKFYLLIVLLILLFLGLALVNTFKITDTSPYEITVVKKADHTFLENPRIFEMDDILYSENGDIYEDFKNAPGYSQYSSKFDGTGMVATVDDKVYYVDGNLEPRFLSVCTTRAVISKKADFVLYNDETENGCVYDAVSDKKISISAGYIPLYNSAISSNGRYVAFYEREVGTIIRDVQNTDSYRVISKNRLDVIAVSPDGERAFLKNYDDDLYFSYCYHDGELFEIARGGNFDFVVNDECTEAFVSDTYNTYFYSTDMEKGQKILEDDIFRVHCQKGPYGIVGKYSSHKVADVDSFKGCILETIADEYYFISPYERLVLLEGYRSYDYLGYDNGAVYRLYTDSDYHLCVETMKDGYVTSNRLKGADSSVMSYVASDNLSRIYYVDRDDNIWLYENGKKKLMHNSPNIRSSIQYDKFSERLFFIDNDCLYSVGDGPQDCRLEFENADYISHNYFDYEDFTVFSYNMEKRYVRVFGNYMLLDS